METQIRARARPKGGMIGRPKRIGKFLLNKYEEEIFDLMKKGSQKQFIIKSYGVPSAGLLHWLKKHELDNVEPKP